MKSLKNRFKFIVQMCIQANCLKDLPKMYKCLNQATSQFQLLKIKKNLKRRSLRNENKRKNERKNSRKRKKEMKNLTIDKVNSQSEGLKNWLT